MEQTIGASRSYDTRIGRPGKEIRTAFVVSLVQRLGGGEPILKLPTFISYPKWFTYWLTGNPSEWYDQGRAMPFPFRTRAALAGMVLLPLVSRLTARWDPPRPLR
jgi:high affinity choline transporter 7